MLFGKGLDRFNISAPCAPARERDNWTQGQLYRGIDCAHICCPTPTRRNADIKCQKDEGPSPGSDIHYHSVGSETGKGILIAVELLANPHDLQSKAPAAMCRLGGKKRSGITVHSESPLATPRFELSRHDNDFLHDVTSSHATPNSSLGGSGPILISGWEQVTVYHASARPSIILLAYPSHATGHDHRTAPFRYPDA
jgi:hypothetical protein